MDIVDNLTVLRTKVTPPRLAAYVVERPRLFARMAAALELPLSIVIAPTGYGKTTLVSSWLATIEGRVAWVSLDEHDNDVASVMTYLAGALQDVAPDARLAIQGLLHSPQEVPLHVLADTLVSDLDKLPGPIVIVLDDYHTIELEAVHTLMERVVRNLPHHAHVAILSRHTPPFSLARMRAQGTVNEIGTSDLAFTTDEAGSMLAHVTGRQLDPRVVEVLEARTEGWAAALQLAGLSAQVKSSHDLADQLAQLANGVIVDYLIEEVAAVIPEDMQEFLIRTAIPDQLSVALCSTILEVGHDQAAAMLERVIRSNLFVVALDDDRQWYRYHHLMRDVLRRLWPERLTSAELRALHVRAGQWFAVNGQIGAAITHLAQAGDDTAAAELVESQVDRVLQDDDWRLLARWLQLLPESVGGRPGLLIARAHVERIKFRHQEANRLADQAAAVVQDAGDTIAPAQREYLLGNVASIRGSAAYWAMDPEAALRLARQALDHFGDTRPFSAIVSMQQTAFALAAQGESEAAILYLEQQLERTPPEEHDMTARLLLGMCSVYLGEGRLLALEPVLNTFQAVAKASGQALTFGWSQFGLGYLAYEWNDLETAERHFRVVTDARYAVNVKNVADSYIGLCLTLQAARRDDEADTALDELRAFLTEGGYSAYLPVLMSLESRLSAMRTGNTVYAGPAQWNASANLAFMECAPLTAAWQHILNGSPDDLSTAGNILQETALRTARTYNKRRLIQVEALSAMRWHALGEPDNAARDLRASLDLAARGRFIRIYLDLGESLVPCLEALQHAGVHVDYVGDILAAYRQGAIRGDAGLTNREMDVLERMAQRKSNKEIAADLFLSPQTVKTHAQNMYRKLGASNRREAVEIGRRSGLIA